MNKKYGILFLSLLFVSLYAGWWQWTKQLAVNGLSGMKKIVLAIGGNFSAEDLEAWILPDNRLRFDQVVYLATHNAHANIDEGFVYAQQLWSVKKQLDRGVRQLLLDIWTNKKGELLLCHKSCNISTLLRIGRKHKSWVSSLQTIKDWLDTHPEEIVSLELENYASGEQTYNDILSVDGLDNYILKHEDYEPLDHDGYWPTLRWLQERNKRLIIFDTQDNHLYAYDTNVYMVRNMYGSLRLEKAARLRGVDIPERRLFQLNYFGTISSPFPRHNRPDQLQKLLLLCWQKGVVEYYQKPNFIAIDFVDRGNAMKWVNELNEQAACQLG